mmetsp:Transcript_32248/g.99402  ORF Transcript_32248/g.99402 Transcript_32248/m.99402 type:complete len:99 (+) Transcript_32248:2230-2526(+)
MYLSDTRVRIPHHSLRRRTLVIRISYPGHLLLTLCLICCVDNICSISFDIISYASMRFPAIHKRRDTRKLRLRLGIWLGFVHSSSASRNERTFPHLES